MLLVFGLNFHNKSLSIFVSVTIANLLGTKLLEQISARKHGINVQKYYKVFIFNPIDTTRLNEISTCILLNKYGRWQAK